MTIRAVLYDAKGDDRAVDLERDDLKVNADRLLWIDLDDRNSADLGRAAMAVGLESEALVRTSRDDREARILRLPDRIVLTLGTVEPDDVKAERREIDIVIGENHVVTVHEGSLRSLEEFRSDLELEVELGKLDAASFSVGLIDALITSFFRQVEAIEREIDRLDELAVSATDGNDFLGTVLVLRRRIARLRRALAPNREALAPLDRPDFELHADLGHVWPGLIDRLERAIDAVENTRDLLVGSFDLYLGRASQRTNDVMKVLTLVSAIALPGIVLAGVMGMNFKPPLFDDPNNFYVVVAAMVVFAIAILIVARVRRWI